MTFYQWDVLYFLFLGIRNKLHKLKKKEKKNFYTSNNLHIILIQEPVLPAFVKLDNYLF